jgi:hypothetical protein
MSWLEVLKMIPWKVLAVIAAAGILFFVFGGLRGCARFSRAVERMDPIELKDILLSPASDYDKL